MVQDGDLDGVRSVRVRSASANKDSMSDLLERAGCALGVTVLLLAVGGLGQCVVYSVVYRSAAMGGQERQALNREVPRVIAPGVDEDERSALGDTSTNDIRTTYPHLQDHMIHAAWSMVGLTINNAQSSKCFLGISAVEDP